MGKMRPLTLTFKDKAVESQHVPPCVSHFAPNNRFLTTGIEGPPPRGARLTVAMDIRQATLSLTLLATKGMGLARRHESRDCKGAVRRVSAAQGGLCPAWAQVQGSFPGSQKTKTEKL